MPRISFSPLAIKNLQPPPAGSDGQVLQADYFDESMPGFGLRISSNKVRTWFAMGRLRGKVVRISLGRLPRNEFEQGLSLAQARAVAMEYRGKLKSGVDPRAKPEEEAPQPTFKEIAGRFVEEWAKPRTRRWNETERILEKLVTPGWATKPIGTITRRDVGEVLDRVATENGPIMSNRVLAVVGKLFSWWEQQDDRFHTPIIRGMARGVAQSRDRVLTRPEIARLWTAAPEDLYGSILRFLLLSARRREEVAGMLWAEIEITPDGQRIWCIPAERSKNGRPDVVPITDRMWAIVDGQTKWKDCPFVFSPNGETQFGNFGRRKEQLDRLLKFEKPWVVHDLRRTARTLMAEAGVSEEVAERVVGHVLPGVKGIYNRYQYVPEKLAALQKLDALVTSICAT